MNIIENTSDMGCTEVDRARAVPEDVLDDAAPGAGGGPGGAGRDLRRGRRQAPPAVHGELVRESALGNERRGR